VTRAALRILNRARADAWRRVGIPTTWAPEAPAATPDPAAAPETTETAGQNVAGESNGHAGNGRPAGAAHGATDETPKD
jgi:hypothetical protein